MPEHSIGEPRISYGISRNIFEWDICSLKVIVDRITDDGKVELYFYHTNGAGNVLLHMGQANLLSSTMQRDFIKALSTRGLEIDWQTVLTYIARDTMQHLRQGDNVVYLSESYGKERPKFLLPPLFVEDSANIIYADRSSAKSLVAIMIDIALSLPWHDNDIGLSVGTTPRKVLYCDWESNPQIIGWLKECLRKGMLGDCFCDLPYLHCAGALADNIHHIQSKIEETQSSVIIIDSLGMAVADDLNMTKPAFSFFSALRQLPVTPIIIAHTAKDVNNKRKTVYGNAYYENEARSVWEINKDQQMGQNDMVVSLFQRKSPPFTGYSEPIAWHFTFDANTIKVTSTTPNIDKRTMEATPPSETDIALGILYESEQPLSAPEILSRSEGQIKPTNIHMVLKRIVAKTDFGVVKTPDGKYAGYK